MAQYQAKENGRNRVEVFAPALHPMARRRLDHEGALREALLDARIVAHSNPRLIEMAASSVPRPCPVDSSGRGVLSAAEFVPLAESPI